MINSVNLNYAVNNDRTLAADEHIECQRRRNRYSVNVRPDSEATFECLVVDHIGDSGGFQEVAYASFGDALCLALNTTRDRGHVAFGAPVHVGTPHD